MNQGKRRHEAVDLLKLFAAGDEFVRTMEAPDPTKQAAYDLTASRKALSDPEGKVQVYLDRCYKTNDIDALVAFRYGIQAVWITW